MSLVILPLLLLLKLFDFKDPLLIFVHALMLPSLYLSLILLLPFPLPTRLGRTYSSG